MALMQIIISLNMLQRNIIDKHIFYYFFVRKKNVVGLNVRSARKAAKPPLTQLDLIARLQVLGMMIDQSALSKIENGQRPVTDIEVVILAEALKVSTAYLLENVK